MINAEPSRRKRLLILCICCMSILLVGLDVTIVNVAIPSIRHDLGASIGGAQWTIDAYALVLASFLLFSGSLADRIGRKRIFIIGLAVFAIGSLLCGFAPSIGWLIFFRMIQAIGGSMLNPVALSIVSNTFMDGKERSRAVGVWSGVMGLSTAAGPIIGGILVSSVHWSSIFWINIPIAILALILTILFVPDSKAITPRHFDPIGQIFVIGFLATLLYGIIDIPEHGFSSVIVLGCFVASFLLFISMILYERRHIQPLIELRFFKSIPFSGAVVIAICAFIGMGGFLFMNTLYLQDVKGLSAVHAGLSLLPMALAMLVFGPLAGRVVAIKGTRLPLVFGAACVTIAAVLFTLSSTNLDTLHLFIYYAIIGVGLGTLNTGITSTALSGMPRSESGVAAATTSTSRQVGTSLGVAIIGTTLAIGTGVVRPGAAFNSAWHTGWLILAIVGAILLIVALVSTSKWGLRTADRLSQSIQTEG